MQYKLNIKVMDIVAESGSKRISGDVHISGGERHQ